MGKANIIIGVDPGTNLMGIASILAVNNHFEIMEAETVRLSGNKDPLSKLSAIYQHSIKYIRRHQADSMAIEAPFYGKNVQSMLKLGRAQGVSIAAAVSEGLPVFEYAPRKIKQSITGNGNASKHQVAGMIAQILKVKELPYGEDATDAIAAAVCHLFQKHALSENSKSSGNSSGSWERFLKDNPDRLL